jgi:hypothetical protein
MAFVAAPAEVRTMEAMSTPTPTTAWARGFSAESELAPAVRSWLAGEPGVVAVVDEVDSGTGIADLVAGHSGSAALPWRRAVGDPLMLRLLEFTQSPVSATDLHSWAPHGWCSLRDRVVVPALEAGLLAVEPGADGGAWFFATLGVEDPFASLTAVELKLRDWRRGIAQAGRYRLWAERSYVALPHARVSDVVLAEAERNRVGVLAVRGGAEESWTSVMLDAPHGVALQPQRRRLGAERVLAGVQEPSARVAGSPIR